MKTNFDRLKVFLLFFLLLGSGGAVQADDDPVPKTGTSKNSVSDLTQKGLDAMKAGRKEEAFKYFERSAENGDPDGDQNLGGCYWFGLGVKQDYSQAVKWFKKPAALGRVGPQYCLANAYYSGLGVEKDYEKAFKWYQKSADQGNSDAEYGLGNCFYYGQGVPRDFFQAFEWFQKSADQGNAYGEYGVGECYLNGQGVSRDYAQAMRWYQKSADQGNGYGEYGVGYCYELGMGVGKDMGQARHFLQLSVDQNIEEAKIALKDLNNPAFSRGGGDSVLSIAKHGAAKGQCYPGFPNGIKGTFRTEVRFTFEYNPEGDFQLLQDKGTKEMERLISELGPVDPNGPQFTFPHQNPSDLILYIEFCSRGRNSKGEAKAYWANVIAMDYWGTLFTFTTQAHESSEDSFFGDWSDSIMEEAAKQWYDHIANGWTCH